MSQQVGDHFGSYRLLRKLGEGGFSEVWLGRHKIDQREAAVKILNVQVPSMEEQNKFLNEARLLGRLDDPHIIKLLDCGIQGDQPFLILEYAPNGTLRQKHPRGSTLPLNLIVNYVKQITMGLQYAHDKRIIHRDIKPENMLLNGKNQVLLSDFGIALPGQTLPYPKTQDIMGTTSYMAPEQLDGHPALATDQYALAVVVYEWLCGGLPFKGLPIEIRLQQKNRLAPQLKKVASILPTLEQVLGKALSEQVEDRYRRVQDFAEALEQAVNDPGALLNIQTQNGPGPLPLPINIDPAKNTPPQLNVVPLPGKSPLPASPLNNPGVQPLPQQPVANPQIPPGSPNYLASPFVAPPANHNLPPVNIPNTPAHNPLVASPNNALPNPGQNSQPSNASQPMPPLQAQGPLRLPDQGGNNLLGSPFVAPPNPNSPQQTLYGSQTVAAPPLSGGNPFAPSSASTGAVFPTGKYSTGGQAKWYGPWLNPRFYKESRNQFFLYGGGIVDFILAISLGILLNVPSVESGWYVWFFSLLIALVFRSVSAMLKKRWYALFFVLCLSIYWFMGSLALGIDIRNVIQFEPAPPLIIALIVLIAGLLLHINYVLKNKR